MYNRVEFLLDSYIDFGGGLQSVAFLAFRAFLDCFASGSMYFEAFLASCLDWESGSLAKAVLALL